MLSPITYPVHAFPYHLSNLTIANPFFPVNQWWLLVTLLRIPQVWVPHSAALPEQHPAPIPEEVNHLPTCLSSFCPIHQLLTSPWYKGFRIPICLLASLMPPALPPACWELPFASYSFDANRDGPIIHPDPQATAACSHYLIRFLCLQFLQLGVQIHISSVSSKGRVL